MINKILDFDKKRKLPNNEARFLLLQLSLSGKDESINDIIKVIYNSGSLAAIANRDPHIVTHESIQKINRLIS